MSASPASIPVLDQSKSSDKTSFSAPALATVPFPPSRRDSIRPPSLYSTDDKEMPLPLTLSQPPISAVNPEVSANAVAGPSSAPITSSAKPLNPTMNSGMRGTKQKPIIVEEKEEGEISDDEIVEINPIPISRPIPQRQRSPPRPSLPRPPSPPRAPIQSAHSISVPQLSQRITQPLSRGQPPSAPASHLTKNQRKKQEKKARQAAQKFQIAQRYQEQLRQQYPQDHRTPPHIQPQFPRNPSPTPSMSIASDSAKGKAKESEREEEAEVSLELNDDVAQTAENLSPEEAEQYIDIIRNLISEGVSPDTLVERGAAPEYVMKVCQEIVDSTKKRKALWLESQDQPREESEASSIPLLEPNKSPSPEVEIIADYNESGIPGLTRIKSDGSNQSDGTSVIDRMSGPVNPEKPMFAHPIKVESYKPGQTSTSSSLPLRPTTLPSSDVTHPRSDPNSLRKVPPHRRGRNRDIDNTNDADSLQYNDEVRSLSSTSLPRRPPSTTVDSYNPFAVLESIPLTPPFSPRALPDGIYPPPEPVSLPPPAPPALTAEQTLQNTLLETRRKALESMKRRRAAVPKTIPTAVPPMQADATSIEAMDISDDPNSDLQRSIEEQMASIEREVMEAAAAATTSTGIEAQAFTGESKDAVIVGTEEGMDVDDEEPEEGEITPSVDPTPLPPVDIVLPATLLSKPPRGIKRAHAEDLNENKSTSIPSRSLPPTKKRPFGASQRAQRLVLHLDDSDSDSSDDEEDGNGMQTPIHVIVNGDVDIIERQRMLEEKEASIRKLREQIAARMAARKTKSIGDTSLNGGTPLEKTASGQMAEVVKNALQPNDVESGIESPIPADVRQLTRDLVKAEAEVEAMEVDSSPQGNRIIETGANKDETFTEYQPLLNRYPQLGSTNLDPTLLSLIQIDTMPESVDVKNENKVDKPLLNSIVLTRLLKANPSLVACQAEISGGKCADRKCKDIHLDKGIASTGK
uniref:Putative zinc-finger domain-containing protein n=1 Tax=Kwoniella pini CBS 10737 TaxID=1296096 RepID=A0A1B9IC44_9TREE|nr:uncharacterized protein I206_00529 [Kwoniella pini CBS 10737]OCF53228.1 hypothetical protein I206_00529 [Kwoniella pini CBS 10737]